jgi:hypothetical protein
MDNYVSGGIGAITVFVLGLAGWIYRTVNHKRVRSSCCGTKIEVSLDVEETTPTNRIDAEVAKRKEISESKKEIKC